MIPLRASIPYDPRHTERVPAVDRDEIDQLIRQTLSAFDVSNEEIQKLSIECVSNLTTSRALSRELSDQGHLKRLWYNFTGKNQKLQSTINRSHSHSMYANQKLLILLMEQNKSAMELSIHLDQKQQMINLDFSEQFSQQNQEIQRICQILQKHEFELDDAVFKCGVCGSFFSGILLSVPAVAKCAHKSPIC